MRALDARPGLREVKRPSAMIIFTLERARWACRRQVSLPPDVRRERFRPEDGGRCPAARQRRCARAAVIFSIAPAG